MDDDQFSLGSNTDFNQDILPRASTNTNTPVPQTSTNYPAKRKSISDRVKAVFTKNNNVETTPRENSKAAVTDLDDAGYNTDSDKYQAKNHRADESFGDIPVVEDEDGIDSKRSSKMSRNHPDRVKSPSSLSSSRSPVDEYEMRNVNESNSDLYQPKSKDGVLIASHSNAAPDNQAASPGNSAAPSKFKEKLISLAKYCLKQTILVGMVLAYAIAGAYLFALLEVHTEQKSCQESKGADIANVIQTKAKLIEYIQFNVTSNALDTTKDNETYAVQRLEEMLTQYRDDVLSIGYGGEDCTQTSWVIINGILFCLTVVTTIGYGQVFPKTWEGQIVCICYATIGIPLFVMCLANISGVLGYMFRWTYVKVCCGVCSYRKKKKEEAASLADNYQGNNNNNATIINKADTTSARIVDDNEDLEDEMNDKDDIENASVPLTVTIFVVTAYILGGSILFHFTDGFGFIESAYFCFVTLTTIGFGDLVPGQDFTDPLGPYKLAVGCAYILIGLSVLGMAFDLMQEELISKFSWFGKKIGLIDPDEDEEDEAEKEKEKLKDDMSKKEESDYNQKNQKMSTVNEK